MRVKTHDKNKLNLKYGTAIKKLTKKNSQNAKHKLIVFFLDSRTDSDSPTCLI
jgi:hypothetical protein